MAQDDVGWFYEVNGETKGPISMQELRVLFGARKLGPQTIVWTKAMTQRRPAGMLPALAAMIPADGGALNLLLPVGPQSGLAIAAGYLGIFSLFLVPGPLALALGIFALRDLKEHPHKRGVGRAYTGIILGACATIVLAVVLLSRL
jgi:hypothetical protein